jgi:hypothetical protein
LNVSTEDKELNLLFQSLLVKYGYVLFF